MRNLCAILVFQTGLKEMLMVRMAWSLSSNHILIILMVQNSDPPLPKRVGAQLNPSSRSSRLPKTSTRGPVALRPSAHAQHPNSRSFRALGRQRSDSCGLASRQVPRGLHNQTSSYRLRPLAKKCELPLAVAAPRQPQATKGRTPRTATPMRVARPRRVSSPGQQLCAAAKNLSSPMTRWPMSTPTARGGIGWMSEFK